MRKSTTIGCDWPGCGASITVERDHDFSDGNWESRGEWAACPEHRFKTTAEFEEEIDAHNPLPCPFCGGCDLGVDWTDTDAFASCRRCNAMGPDVPIEAETDDQPAWRLAAFKAWNRRRP